MNPARSRPGRTFGEIPLARLSLALVGITGGGILLGSLLALYANPVPLPRPASQWEKMFRQDEIASAGERLWIEAPPTDLQPGWQSSYRPDLDYDTVVTGWVPPPLPEWQDEPAPAEQIILAEPVPAPIERAAEAAADAAADARAAVAAAPPAPPAGGSQEPRGLW